MIAIPPKAEVNPEPGTNTVLTIQYQPGATPPPEVTAAEFNMFVGVNQQFNVNGRILSRAEFWQLMRAELIQPIVIHGGTIRLTPEG